MLTIQHSGPDGEITTTFEYDGIQRLVRVTDTEGNVTTSTYDMGDRRTEVNHTASGITTFTYDALGNVLTKQTANLAKEGKFITYDYDYQRLTGINYPDHPENNVKYYYGGRNASQNRIGRLMLREDGTGAIEYFYGKMGEVTKTRRTMIVPNQAIATYVTQWTYDSHNRLLEMIYPDEEKITYSYNLGGQLEKVHGYKSYGYDYVSKIGYDKFEQRTYLKYCNGAETFYTYDPQRRRLQNLTVNSGGNTIMDNAYTYDAVSNVLSVIMVRQCQRVARVADRWRITIHTMPSIVLSVQLALILVQTTRPQTTPFRWAMTTCTASHRSVRFSRRIMCNLTARSMLAMTCHIPTAQTLVRNSSLPT